MSAEAFLRPPFDAEEGSSVDARAMDQAFSLCRLGRTCGMAYFLLADTALWLSQYGTAHAGLSKAQNNRMP